MKKFLTRYVCCILCILLLTFLTACGTDLVETEPSTEPLEATDPVEIVTAPKIAATSSQGLNPAHNWYWDDATQLRYSNVPWGEMLFLTDANAALAGLTNGTYDVIILPGSGDETPSFDNCEVLPLYKDAIIFVHGNPTATDASYDHTLEKIRSIYEDGGEFYWDTTHQEPLIPAFRFHDMSQELSYIFGIESTADGILIEEEFDAFVWSNEGQHDSPLYPVYYSFLNGDAGINGVVISVDGVLPTDASIADGTYPLAVTFYAVYPAGDPDSANLASELQRMA